jgi:MoaA/NifB/PqqE/SkfB family radical SAM enzyme/class 3 adenylate cyclase
MANLGYLQLTRDCLQSCRFCSNPPTGVELSLSEMKEELGRLASMGYDGVILTGGEPTISPLLLPALAHAAELGLYSRIITNGQRLADIGFFREAASAGLTHIHASLHSHDARTHDFITRHPGAHEALTTALSHVPEVGVTADVNTVINTYNSDHLDAIVRWLVERFPFIRHVVWNNMDPDGNRAEKHPDCIPRHHEFAASLERAMTFLHASGRTFRAERVPLCFMPKFAWASTETRKIVKEEERCIRFLDRKGFVHQQEFLHGKGAACDVCRFDGICAGMFSMARTFDERELSPIFEDPLPVIQTVLRRDPSPELMTRLEARRGRRSRSEQPSQEQRDQARGNPAFTRTPPQPQRHEPTEKRSKPPAGDEGRASPTLREVREIQGLVWSVDIVGFGRRSAEEQVALVRFLSDWLGEQSLFSGLERNNDFFIHGTGDGFLVTLRHRDELPWKLIHAAGALVRRCRTLRERPGGLDCSVRQGLHVGTFVHPVGLFGNAESVGDGLNHGSYVAAAAGPDQIYISDDFVSHLVRVYGEAMVLKRLRLHPPLRSPGFQIPIKHGQLVRVRHVGRPGVDWSTLSPTLTRLYETQLRLEEQLRLIQQAVEGSLTSDDRLAAELDTRVSIWTVVADRLALTPLRRGWARRTTPAPSLCLEPPEGPIARALTDDLPVVVVGLPSGEDESVTSRWEELGMKPHLLPLLGRLPRAILVVPFRFGRGVRGVICVDFNAPLDPMAEVLRLLGQIIRQREGEHVAALLQLRLA